MMWIMCPPTHILLTMNLSCIVVAILATFFPTIPTRLDSRAPCRKEVRRQPCLVLRDARSEDISSRSLGSLVNPGNPAERTEVERASRQLVLPASNSKIGCSQTSRQENDPQAAKRLVPKKLVASSPEFKQHGMHEPSIQG